MRISDYLVGTRTKIRCVAVNVEKGLYTVESESQKTLIFIYLPSHPVLFKALEECRRIWLPFGHAPGAVALLSEPALRYQSNKVVWSSMM